MRRVTFEVRNKRFFSWSIPSSADDKYEVLCISGLDRWRVSLPLGVPPAEVHKSLHPGHYKMGFVVKGNTSVLEAVARVCFAGVTLP